MGRGWSEVLASTWPPLRRPWSELDSESPGKGSQHFTLVSRAAHQHPGQPCLSFLLLTHSPGLLSATRRDPGFSSFLASCCLLLQGSCSLLSCAARGPEPPAPTSWHDALPVLPAIAPHPDGSTVFRAWPLGPLTLIFSCHFPGSASPSCPLPGPPSATTT